MLRFGSLKAIGEAFRILCDFLFGHSRCVLTNKKNAYEVGWAKLKGMFVIWRNWRKLENVGETGEAGVE